MKINYKIIIATGTYPPEISGQAFFVYNLVKKLPHNIQTKIITYSHKKILNKNIITVKRNVYRYFYFYYYLKRNIKQMDIIYAQDLISSGLPAALAKNKNNKLIIRLGGDFLWEKMINSTRTKVTLKEYYFKTKTLKEKIYLIIYKFVLYRANKIIFNTKYQADLYRKIFKLSSSKIVIINSPIEVDQVLINSKRKTSNEIIFAGRFIPVKNLIRLIKVFKKIRTTKRLILIGSGPQKKELLKLAQADSRIRIENSLSQINFWQRLSQSYLFILPSITDLNPNVALEALALNKPVILTQENGLPVELKNNFKLVNPLIDYEIKSAIEYFLDKNNYQYWLNKLNINFVNYTWQKNIKQHLEIFNKL